MGDIAETKEIASFLEEAKKLVSSGKYDFVPRRKNMMALAKYGLTLQDAKDEIIDLVVSDYYKGPKEDYDRPGVLWEFMKNIDGVNFYIKLKIVQEDGADILKCISFHDAEFA